jgi:hypothetical protein
MLTQSEHVDGPLPYTIETWQRLKS